MLVTWTGPVMLLQPLTKGRRGRPWIGGRLVGSPWAATRAGPPATGPARPWPKMVPLTDTLNCVVVGPAEVMITFEPYLKAAASMVEKPVLTFLISRLTSWLVLSWPKPRAGGETTTSWVAVADCTVASMPLKAGALEPEPKNTWTGGTKPWPTITIWVPPSLVPDAGDTEKTCGCSPPPPPGM